MFTVFYPMIARVFIVWRFLLPECRSFCFFWPVYRTFPHVYYDIFNFSKVSDFTPYSRLNTATPLSDACFSIRMP
jgi:hypothetical protein